MPVYTILSEDAAAVPVQHPVITLVGPDGAPYNPATSIPSGTYVQPVAIATVASAGAIEGAAVQTALNRARDAVQGGVVVVPKKGNGVVLIDTKLVLYSNTHLKLDEGVRIKRASGFTGDHLLENYAAAQANEWMDGAATSGSTAVTSAGFTSGRVGEPFTIWGPGPRYWPLYGPMRGTVTGVGTGTLNSRTEAATTTATNIPTVDCLGITEDDLNQPVSGARIPANAYIGTVWPGHSFNIFVAGAPVNALSVGATTLTIGGAALWSTTRTAACGTTNGNPTVTCVSAVEGDRYQPLSGAGIPPYAYVGAVVPGVSITPYVHGSPVNATATGSPTLTIGRSAYVAIGVRDHDITIEGGIWDNAGNAGAGADGYAVNIRRCDRFKAWHTSHREDFVPTTNYCWSLTDLNDWQIIDPHFQVERSAIQGEGPLFNGLIDGARGRSGDDFIAFTTGSYPVHERTIGPVVGCTIRNTQVNNGSGGIAIVGNSQVFPFDDITIDGVTGKLHNAVAVRILDDLPIYMPMGTRVESMVVKGLRVRNSRSANPPIIISATKVRHLSILDSVHRDNGTWVQVQAGATVDRLLINGFDGEAMTDAVVRVDGAVGFLSLDNIDVTPAALLAMLVKITAGSVCSRVLINNWLWESTAGNEGWLVYQQNGAAPLKLKMSNGWGRKMSRFLHLEGTADVDLDNVDIDTPGVASIAVGHASAVVRVNAGIVRQTSDPGPLITAGGTLAINGARYQIDYTKLTPATGDAFYNTNAANDTATGPVIYDGTMLQPATGRLMESFSIAAAGVPYSHAVFDTFDMTKPEYRGSTGAQLAEVTLRLSGILRPGTWTFELVHNTYLNRGQYTISTGPTGIGPWTDLSPVVEGYLAGGTAPNIRTPITGLTIGTGVKFLRVKMLDKNASSSGYYGNFSLLAGTRTTA